MREFKEENRIANDLVSHSSPKVIGSQFDSPSLLRPTRPFNLCSAALSAVV